MQRTNPNRRNNASTRVGGWTLRLIFPASAILLCVGQGTRPCQATPIIGNPSVSPSSVNVGQPTALTVTCAINVGSGDPALLSNGVNLVRLDANNQPIKIIDVMHDDGANGDAVANDGIFTLRFT